MSKKCFLTFILFLFIMVRPVPACAELHLNDYRDIPGITADEVAAIEELKLQKTEFIFGSMTSTESYIADDGTPGGFNIMFCQLMSELFGIQIIENIFEWDDLIPRLDDHRIDFTGELTVSPERLDRYFMTSPIAEHTINIFYNRYGENPSIREQQRILRYGFLQGSITAGQVKSVANEEFEIIEINNYGMAVSLLENQTIDAFFEESSAQAYFGQYDFINSETYFPLIYSPISLCTANPALEPIISVMQKYIQNGGNSVLAELYTQGNLGYTSNKLFSHFTAEEKQYIKNLLANGGQIKIAMESDNYPNCFYNEKEDEFQGTAIDILYKISNLTGIEFLPANQPNTNWPTLLEMLSQGEVPMITELVYFPERQGHFLWTEEPYSTDRLALISLADSPDVNINQILNYKLGVSKQSVYEEIYQSWFPSQNRPYYSYDNNQEAFAALEKGEIDLFLTSCNILLSQSNYYENLGFKANVILNYPISSSFGFNINEPILCSIISKAQAYVPSEDISSKWGNQIFDYKSKLAREITAYLLLFGSILLLAFVALLYFYKKNRQINKNLEIIVSDRTHELEMHAATLSTIFNSIPDLVFCKDLDLRFTRCNNRFEQYMHCKEADILGKCDYDLAGVDLTEAMNFRAADLEIIREAKTKVYEETITAADGTKRLFETIKTPLLQGNFVIGIMGISRDITERKAAEAEARIASRAKSDFLARMSHEIRTPLNAIMGMSQIAKNSITDPKKAVHSINEIILASTHLLGVLNNILDMSKIESGKFEIIQEPFNLRSAMREVENIVSHRCREKSVKFLTNIYELPDATLLGDKLRLNQVLINLLGNAIKFTDIEGFVSFQINLLEETRDYVKLRFVVTDNGIGMTDEQVSNLFTAFEQADSSIAAKFGGTGLGLAISQNLVQLMGGIISVESKPGIGSTFEFQLQLTKSSDTASSSEKVVFDLDLSGRYVLLVEDLAINRVILSELLDSTNVNIEEAEDGQQAVEMFSRSAEGHYDLIFMDIQMPVMNGYEATETIRALHRNDAKEVPIIAMTANAYSEDVKQALSVGMNGHLSKPIDLQAVLYVLDNYLTEK